jgi:hypothetical protein
MDYDHDGPRMPDDTAIRSAMLAEIMRCIAKTLLDKANELERPVQGERKTNWSSKGDDAYNF